MSFLGSLPLRPFVLFVASPYRPRCPTAVSPPPRSLAREVDIGIRITELHRLAFSSESPQRSGTKCSLSHLLRFGPVSVSVSVPRNFWYAYAYVRLELTHCAQSSYWPRGFRSACAVIISPNFREGTGIVISMTIEKF